MPRFTAACRNVFVGTFIACAGALMPTTILAQEGNDRERAIRERDEDTRERRDEDARERGERQRKELQLQLGRREEMVSELKRRLGQLKDGQDKEAAEIKANLDRVVAEMSKLRAELKGDRGDRERRDNPDKGRQIEAFRDQEGQILERQADLKRQVQRMTENLKELAAEGKHELAEQMERSIKSLNSQIEKLSAQMKRQRQQRELRGESARDLVEKPRRSPEAEARDSEAAKRARHLYAAAKNLYAAGMPDLADKLQRQADQLAARPEVDGKRRVEAEVDLEFTNRKADKPESVRADLVGELRALRREVDELRGQMKRLQGERSERR
jgi:hypothetical protein